MIIFIKRIINLKNVFFIGFITFVILVSIQKSSVQAQADYPYLIKVNRVYNTITVYEKGEDGKFDAPVRAMVCSVGKLSTQTSKGTFQTKDKYRWKSLMGDVWGQYSTRIVGGGLFHSVYYYSYNPATLATGEYNKLGTSASHGCIRLTVEDAKWIYDNCPVGTTVVIYDDKNNPGPLGKPEAIKLPTSVRWDPTDPSKSNPYKDKLPSISGARNVSLSWGEQYDLLKGVKAKSSVGTDITSNLQVEENIDIYKAGDYNVTYTVTDALGRTGSKTVDVTVKESKQKPVFEGIENQIIGADTVINRELVLSNVKAHCSDVLLKNDDIDVNIEKLSDTEYKVTYYISIGKKISTKEYATYYIDKEAPVFTGITDRILEPGYVPDVAYALTDVTVSDNYTALNQNDITVTIENNPDGSYQVTYEAVDRVGNVAKETVRFHYDEQID